MGLTSASP